MTELKFIDACFHGEALLEDIDDYIEKWHESDSEEEIYEYLGMTWDEYSIWVENDSMLKTILYTRSEGIPIKEYIKTNTAKLVARASSPEEAKLIKEWLVRTGKIKE